MPIYADVLKGVLMKRTCGVKRGRLNTEKRGRVSVSASKAAHNQTTKCFP